MSHVAWLTFNNLLSAQITSRLEADKGQLGQIYTTMNTHVGSDTLTKRDRLS